MKKLVLGLLIFGLTTQLYSQVIELSEVEISVNYKYLDAVDADRIAKPVKLLEDNALNYQTNKEDLYDDEYDNYKVSFYIPDGKVVAAYNSEGKIIRTIEKYKNIRLPLEVLQAVAKRFPNWAVVENVYLVNYHCDKGIEKQYKIKIKNEDKFVNIKTDEQGNFI